MPKRGVGKTQKRLMEDFVSSIPRGGTFSIYELISYVQYCHKQVAITRQSATQWCRGSHELEYVSTGVWRKTG